jgi:hypothetical protein
MKKHEKVTKEIFEYHEPKLCPVCGTATIKEEPNCHGRGHTFGEKLEKYPIYESLISLVPKEAYRWKRA